MVRELAQAILGTNAKTTEDSAAKLLPGCLPLPASLENRPGTQDELPAAFLSGCFFRASVAAVASLGDLSHQVGRSFTFPAPGFSRLRVTEVAARRPVCNSCIGRLLRTAVSVPGAE